MSRTKKWVIGGAVALLVGVGVITSTSSSDNNNSPDIDEVKACTEVEFEYDRKRTASDPDSVKVNSSNIWHKVDSKYGGTIDWGQKNAFGGTTRSKSMVEVDFNNWNDCDVEVISTKTNK